MLRPHHYLNGKQQPSPRVYSIEPNVREAPCKHRRTHTRARCQHQKPCPLSSRVHPIRAFFHRRRASRGLFACDKMSTHTHTSTSQHSHAKNVLSQLRVCGYCHLHRRHIHCVCTVYIICGIYVRVEYTRCLCGAHAIHHKRLAPSVHASV